MRENLKNLTKSSEIVQNTKLLLILRLMGWDFFCAISLASVKLDICGVNF